MNPVGIIFVIISALIPLYWYIPLANQHDTLAVISQYFGSVSLILMGTSQLLATRVRGIETIFGGMDRIYVLHKWMAVSAIVLAALHDTIDADIDGLGETGFLTDVAETMGEIGFYGLLVLTIVTLITFIPYHYWKWSHRFIGFFFALSAIHYAFILKPFENSDPLGLYVLSFCILGVFSYLYLLLPKHWTSESIPYKINKLDIIDDVTEVLLTPINTGITYKAGQFAFINFDVEGFREAHPYTISASPNDQKYIRFTIKKLGDHTSELNTSLSVGQTAKLSRAYGHFTFESDQKPQIWIAAGIGITPFTAWAESLDTSHKAPITLYYCVASREQALYVKQLTGIADKFEFFKLNLIVSGVDKRLSADLLQQDLGDAINQSRVYFCGPTKMREQLQQGLIDSGLPKSSFYYEAFEIRSGIGIRKALAWFLERYGDRLSTRFIDK